MRWKRSQEYDRRGPPHISVVRPLKDGVISDFGMTSMMLKSFIGRVVPTSSFFTSVRVVIGVPSGVTEVEKARGGRSDGQMGAKEVYIMEEPMAAAIGVGWTWIPLPAV